MQTVAVIISKMKPFLKVMRKCLSATKIFWKKLEIQQLHISDISDIINTSDKLSLSNESNDWCLVNTPIRQADSVVQKLNNLYHSVQIFKGYCRIFL